MTNHQHNPEHAQEAYFESLLAQEPMNLGPLLRACADGELTDAQCERLRDYIDANPDAASQVRFEQALRGCCARVMSSPRCPDALRAKVAAIAADNRPLPDQAAAIESAAERLAPVTRSQSFWARSPMLGVAAAVLLSFAGVLLWQSTQFSEALGVPRAGLTMDQVSYYDRVSDFVAREHTRCCDDNAARAKLVERDIEEAMGHFSDEFGRPVAVPETRIEDAEMDFYGAGECHLPSSARSGHLRFDVRTPGDEPIYMSLFVAPDPGILPLEEGVTYVMSAEACEENGVRLFAWVSNGVQYLLVSEATEEMCRNIRSALQAPETVSRI